MQQISKNEIRFSAKNRQLNNLGITLKKSVKLPLVQSHLGKLDQNYEEKNSRIKNCYRHFKQTPKGENKIVNFI
jgi:hypothetical protein